MMFSIPTPPPPPPQFLRKFYISESRYLKDLTTLVELYYRQLKIAVDSGHVLLRRDQLDTIFLNW